MLEEKRKETSRLLLEKSKTEEGIREIFSSPEKMLEFALATVDYRRLILNNHNVLESFFSYCEAFFNLEKVRTLFRVVGSPSVAILCGSPK